MVIGVGAGVDEFGSELAEAVLEALGNGNAGDGTDREAAQCGEFLTLTGEKVLEVARAVSAFNHFGMTIETTEAFLEVGEVGTVTFGDEDDVSPFQVVAGFAERAAGKNELIAEGLVPVD